VPVEDEEISAELEKSYKKRNIDIHTSRKVESVKKDAKGVTVAFTIKKARNRPCKPKNCSSLWAASP